MPYGHPPSAYIHKSCCPATYELGIEEGKRQERVAAFGAIRRAVRLARLSERVFQEGISADPHRELRWMDDTYNESFALARGIRLAIRAAIGSEKA